MKQRAVVTTMSGSTYIWSPGRDAFWNVDGSLDMMDLNFSGRIVRDERLVVCGSMWDAAQRCWVEQSVVSTSPVRSVIWEDDYSILPGTRGPVRTLLWKEMA